MNFLPSNSGTGFGRRNHDPSDDYYQAQELNDRDIARIHNRIKTRRAERHGFGAQKDASHCSPSTADKNAERTGYESTSSWSYLSSHHSPVTLGDSWDEIENDRSTEVPTSLPLNMAMYQRSPIASSGHTSTPSTNQRTTASNQPSDNSLRSSFPVSETVSDADDEQSSAFEEITDGQLDISAIRRRKLEERQRGKVDEDLRTSLSTLLMLRNATRTTTRSVCEPSNPVDKTMYPLSQSHHRHPYYQSNHHSSSPMSVFNSYDTPVRSPLSMADSNDPFMLPGHTSQAKYPIPTSSLENSQTFSPANPISNQGISVLKNRATSTRKVSDKSRPSSSVSSSIKTEKSKYSPFSAAQDIVVSSDDNSDDDDFPRRSCLGKRRQSNSPSVLSSTPPTVISTQNTSHKRQHHEGRQFNRRKSSNERKSEDAIQHRFEISEAESFSITDIPTSLYSSLTATGLDSGDADPKPRQFKKKKSDDEGCQYKTDPYHSSSSESWPWFTTFLRASSIFSTPLNSWHWIGIGFAVIAAFSTGCIMTMPRLRLYSLSP